MKNRLFTMLLVLVLIFGIPETQNSFEAPEAVSPSLETLDAELTELPDGAEFTVTVPAYSVSVYVMKKLK